MPGQWSVSIELKREENLGKPLFEMCWFYMGIAQIALDPPPSVKRANVEKSAPNHPGKPLHPELEFVNAVTAGGSVKILPVV